MTTASAGCLFPLPRAAKRLSTFATASAMAAVALLLSACSADAEASSQGLTGTVVADGSSTVAPLTATARHLFVGVEPDVEIKNTSTGTAAGFRSFCSGVTDISNASRPISDDEIATCAEAGVDFTEIVVANDGVSVILNPANDWARDLTVEQLASIWAPASAGEVTNWNQVDPGFPDQQLVLFGPGSDSGTLDFFTTAIIGHEGAIRDDYSASEDDNSTVAGVRQDIGAVGFLGLSYVEESGGDVVAASIDGVSPSNETVQDGSYAPLSRSLFIYVSDASYAEKSQVKAFVDFYVENSLDIAERALFVPLTDDQILLAKDALDSLGE